MKRLKQHGLLLFFFVLSFFLLASFSLFQDNDAKMLQLEVKWLIVSGVPILVGLFIGGYIKNFKGFGIELEYKLKDPIPERAISNTEMVASPALEKGTLDRLEGLSEMEKWKINRLQFTSGKQDYYNSQTINGYFKSLKRMQLIEVVDKQGNFLFVISSTKFKNRNSNLPDYVVDINKTDEFIRAISSEKFENFMFDAVTDYVLTTDSIIDGYRKIKKSEQSKRLFPQKDVLPILSEERKMIGTVELQKLALTIAEEVEKDLS